MNIKTPLVEKIENTIVPTAKSMGFDIVRVLVVGSSGKPTLQIMAECPDDDDRKITLDECGTLSKALSAVLDVENTMGDKPYFLEVSSPGVDRPLTKPEDYERFAGKKVKVTTDTALDGRKRFNGILKGRGFCEINCVC